jgi:DNA-binding transcriptional ArsR family regulator
MSKTGDTKRKILEMLEQKKETLTDISDKLELAPSTVSQHLQELMDSGTIRLADDRPRKWKYYEVNKEMTYPNPNDQRFFYAKRFGIPIAVIAIAAVFAFILYTSGGTHKTAAQQVYLAAGAIVPAGSTVFTVSDAPTFYNINALVITVDNASIHSSSGNWIKIPLQANKFDLIKLKNISTLLSGVKLAPGTYDEMVLQVSNVVANVNGTNESVFLPSGKLRIIGDFNISNNSTNWINIDFDLAHSLHITGNGQIIMLPVVNIRHVNDSDLELNESSIIVARAPGRVKFYEEFGMNQNGIMVVNFSTPQNISINASADGKLRFNDNGHAPIIISTKDGFIIGGDATGIINATGNFITSDIGLNKVFISKCLYANSTVNGNQISTNGIASLKGCCYPLPVSVVDGNVVSNSIENTSLSFIIRRCMPYGIGPKKIIMVNASDLNNGKYIGSDTDLNATLVNISVNDKIHGNFTVQCSSQDGALYCNNGSRNSTLVAIGIGRSVGGDHNWIVRSNESENATAHVRVNSDKGIGGIVNIRT